MDSAKISIVRPADNAMPGMPSGERAKIRYAAQQLEAIMITHMLRESHSHSVSQFDKSMAGGMFREMLDEELAQSMAKASAFGLASAIEIAVEPRLAAEEKLRAIKAGEKVEQPEEKPLDTTIHPDSHLPHDIIKAMKKMEQVHE